MDKKLIQVDPIELSNLIHNFIEEIHTLRIALTEANTRIKELEIVLVMVKELNKLRK